MGFSSDYWNPAGDATPGGAFDPGGSGYWGGQPTENKYGSGRSGGFGWGDAFRYAGQALGGISKNRYNDDMSGQYGGRGFGAAGFSGGGIQKAGDLTAVYPNQQGPVYIQGQQGSKGFGGALGGIAGMALGAALAPFTAGTSLAMTAAEGASLGGSLGGGLGSMFDG